jgi:regulatory protein
MKEECPILQDEETERDLYDDLSGEAEASEPTNRMLSWAKNSAIYRLERQMMSEQQLAQAIAKKARQKFTGISAAQIEALSKHAVEFGYLVKALDDQNFAEITTRSAQRTGKSKRQISERLKAKGIDSEIIATSIEDISDLHSALIFARKRRFGPYRREEADEKRKNKEMSAFGRAGYSFEIARRVYHWSEAEAEEWLQEQDVL